MKTIPASPLALSRKSPRRPAWLALALLIAPFIAAAQLTLPAQAQDHLANATVLVIRHAEKPPHGRSLTPAGFARARAYTLYFNPFRADGLTLRINALYAGADTKGSIRPRLTLEPLSHALRLPLNTQFGTDNPAALVHALRTRPHGNHILIAWRHHHIPLLLTALGADPDTLLPHGKWPGSVFDWVVYLRYNAAGRLVEQKLIREPSPLP